MVRARTVVIVAAAICGAPLAACGEDYRDAVVGPAALNDGGVTTGPDGAIVVAAGAFALTLPSPSTELAAGQSAKVRIVVVRGASFTDAISISVTNLPNGIVAGALTIPPSESEGELALNALATATIGTAEVTIGGAAGAVSATTKLSLIVRGPAGTIDTTFGQDGYAASSIGPIALATQADGRIVVLGSRSVTRPGAATPSTAFALSRHSANGAPEADFATGGVDVAEVGSQSDAPSAVAIQADGKILIAGSTVAGTGRDFVIARRMPKGGVDPSFGQVGKVIVSAGVNDYLRALLVQSDGKIVVAGYSSNTTSEMVLGRYLADGKPDADFGIVRWGSSAMADAKLQADGKIVACGGGSVVRWLATGKRDPDFGTDGVAALPPPFTCAAVAVQPDGKIVAGGSPAFQAFRLLPDGKVDTTFGTAGTFTASVPGDGDALDIALSDGVALVGRWEKLPPGGRQDNPAMVKATKDGVLDAAFATSGKYIAPLGPSDARFSHVVTDASGRLLLVENGRIARFWQ